MELKDDYELQVTRSKLKVLEDRFEASESGAVSFDATGSIMDVATSGEFESRNVPRCSISICK